MNLKIEYFKIIFWLFQFGLLNLKFEYVANQGMDGNYKFDSKKMPLNNEY